MAHEYSFIRKRSKRLQKMTMDINFIAQYVTLTYVTPMDE